MLVSCKYCSGMHQRGFNCAFAPKRTKEPNNNTSFRSSYKWGNKSKEIRLRDKYLCQYCLNKDQKISIDNIEVHHIEPLSTNYALRLDNNNLISLCAPCHKLADNNKIDKDYLKCLAANNEAQYQIDIKINK